MATAIREMNVRGAGLIGATAGYGLYLATIEAAGSHAVAGFDRHVTDAAVQLKATRPTAVNLAWAVERQLTSIAKGKSEVRAAQALDWRNTVQGKVALALATAKASAGEDEEHCRMIGQHGLDLIEQVARRKNEKPVNVLTHCNAG